MAIEFAPIIDDITRGFTFDSITISFKNNPAVAFNDKLKIQLQIKEYTTSEVLGTVLSNYLTSLGIYISELSNSRNTDTNKSYLITFSIPSELQKKLTAKKYYKIQLAYNDTEKIANDLVYSTAASGYCIGEKMPRISMSQDYVPIDQMDEDKKLSSSYTKVHQINDISSIAGRVEKLDDEYLSTVRFQVYSVGNKNIIGYNLGDLLQDSGEVFYNNNVSAATVISEEDITKSYQAFWAEFQLKNILEKGKIYFIKFSAWTINNCYLVASNYITLADSDYLNTVFECLPQDEKAIDNGYIELLIKGNRSGDMPLYTLRKRDILSTQWEYLVPFLPLDDTTLYSYKDNTIEQGKIYEYELSYQTTSIINPVTSNILQKKKIQSPQVELQNIFLSDDERQLRIQFNPQISSFKDNILEQKIDTIGGTYPFFYRNGQVRYKEFPISGLISYHLDDNEMFMTKDELKLITDTNTRGDIQTTGNYPTMGLENYNIYAERIFKLKVMEWLNNGKPKLFRSPTEGNYIVRLMNVSLSPNDTVGRMLHTFSCTAYECASWDEYALYFQNHETTVKTDEVSWKIFSGHYQDIFNNSSTFDIKEYLGVENILIKDISWDLLIPTNSNDEIELEYGKGDKVTATKNTNFKNESVYNSLKITKGDRSDGSIYFLYAVVDSSTVSQSSSHLDYTKEDEWIETKDVTTTGNYKLELSPVKNYKSSTPTDLYAQVDSYLVDNTDKRDRICYFNFSTDDTQRTLQINSGLTGTLWKKKE